MQLRGLEAVVRYPRHVMTGVVIPVCGFPGSDVRCRCHPEIANWCGVLDDLASENRIEGASV